MFYDKAKIYVAGGAGGNGIVAYRREKYVPLGGPAGGNGGNGGSVILEVDKGLRTLIDLRYQRKYVADRGKHGEGSKKHGKNGLDITVKVPPGTVVYDDDSNTMLADLLIEGQKFIAANGGRGGRGNASFVTSVHRAPALSENGLPGEERTLRLEMKLLADVGLVGYPNVGKSTLLSTVSAAKPKIAGYHFTTLKPKLGTIYLEQGQSFVMADIPGLIKGAAQGQGLGHEFLRHVERTKLFIHVIDVSGYEGRDPIEDFQAINKELKEYDKSLSLRPQIIALNKFDLINEQELVQDVIDYFTEQGYKVFLISAVTGKGVPALMREAYIQLKEIEENNPSDSEEDIPLIITVPVKEEEPFTVKIEEEVFVVSGPTAKRLAAITDFENRVAVQRFQRLLKKTGIIKALKEAGIQEGDSVKFENLLFDYYDDDGE